VNKKYKKITENNQKNMEFVQQVIYRQGKVSSVLHEYNINQLQYIEIMELMDRYRNAIQNNEKVHYSQFENDVYEIIPQHKSNYYMCEYLTLAFMEEGRWEEVFWTIYGWMPKFNYLVEDEERDK